MRHDVRGRHHRIFEKRRRTLQQPRKFMSLIQNPGQAEEVLLHTRSDGMPRTHRQSERIIRRTEGDLPGTADVTTQNQDAAPISPRVV